MFDNARLLDLIEHALDDDPLCPLCDAPTTIENEQGRLWLVCSAKTRPTSLLARFGAAIVPHERRLVVDLAEDRAA